MKRAWAALAVAATSLVGARAGAAEPPPASVVLVYDAPAECPRAADVEARLRERSVIIDASAALHATITIARERGSLEGRLVTSSGVARTFREASCATLADALAVALAIAAVAAAPPAPPAAAVTAVPVPPPAPPPRRDAPEEPSPRTSAGGFISFGADLALASHLGPRLSFGGSAFAELDAFRARGIAFVARLALEALSAGTAAGVGEAARAEASFTWIGGRLDLGALRIPLGGAEARLGLTVGAGALRAEALPVVGVRDARSVWAPLVDLGPSVRVRVPVGALAFELGAAFLVPLIRARFLLAPSDAVLFTVPPVGAMLSVGVSLGRSIW